MHISEGVLSAPVLIGGGVLAAAGLAVGIRKLPYDRLMPVAILAATFFVGSLVHVPVGPSSAHLVLNGLIGVILGWAAFPAIFIGLLLQALLFQFGGLTVLGVNVVNMSLPAVLLGLAARPLIIRNSRLRPLASFACGALSVIGAAVLTGLSMFFTDEGFLAAAGTLVVAHLPVMLVEGLVTMLTVGFLMKACPEILIGEEKDGTANP